MAMTWRFPSRLADPLWGNLPVTHDTQESETHAGATPRDDQESQDDSAEATEQTSNQVSDQVSDQVSSERESFEVFFQARHRAIFAYLWRMTGEEEAANDLCQETFLRAWRQFDVVDPRAPIHNDSRRVSGSESTLFADHPIQLRQNDVIFLKQLGLHQHRIIGVHHDRGEESAKILVWWVHIHGLRQLARQSREAVLGVVDLRDFIPRSVSM